MVDGISLVCPACGETRDLALGFEPNEDGQLICANCGGEIPVPLAIPEDSLSDDTTIHADPPTVMDPPWQVQPIEDDSIESLLRESHYIQ